MATPPNLAKHQAKKLKPHRPIVIVESLEFERDADAAFSEFEHRALYLALAENPLIGQQVKQIPALRQVSFYGYVVVYAVSSDLATLFLLILCKEDEVPPNSDDDDGGHWKTAKSWAGYLVKGGLFGSGKKLAEWFSDLIN